MIFGCINLTDDCGSDQIKPLEQRLQNSSTLFFGKMPYSWRGIWSNSRALLFQQTPSCENLIRNSGTQDKNGTRNSDAFHGFSEIESFNYAGNRYFVLEWSRIYNLEELRAALPSHFSELVKSKQGLLLASFLHWGETCCQHLVGDFAFSIYDATNNRVFLARDHFGARPLYYGHLDGYLVFSTSVATFRGVPNLDLSLNETWVASYIVGRSESWHETAFLHIKKIPPAHSLFANAHTETFAPIQYFEFSYSVSSKSGSARDYEQTYFTAFADAIRSRIQDSENVGSELSGGLDSSSICVLASRLMTNPSKNLHCFGFANHQLFAEAMSTVAQSCFAASCLNFSPSNRNHGISWREFWSIYGQPLEHNNAITYSGFFSYCEKLEIPILLSGFGGDEFVTNAAPVALVEFWRGRQWKLFWSRQRGNLFTKPLHTIRWIYLFYRHGNKSITARNLKRNGDMLWSHQPIKEEMIEKLGLKKRFFEPLRYDSGRTTQNEFSIDNRWSPMMTARLESCSLVAAKYGVEYRWPLLDIRLINLFLSFPSEQKLGPGAIGRYLHRKVISPLLHPHIAWGPKELIKTNAVLKRLFPKTFEMKKNKRSALDDSYAKIANRAHRKEKRDRPEKKQQRLQPQITPASTRQLHPRLKAIVNESKLQKLDMQNHKVLTEENRFAVNYLLGRIDHLNAWLHYNDTL